MVTASIACTILLLTFPHKKSYLQFLLAKKLLKYIFFFLLHICEGIFTQIIVCYIEKLFISENFSTINIIWRIVQLPVHSG